MEWNSFISLVDQPHEWVASLIIIYGVWLQYRLKGVSGVAEMLCRKIGEHQDQKSLVSAIAAEQNGVLERVILPKSGATVIDVEAKEVKA